MSRWGAPLASAHAFRETETAIGVYWMLHGGPWLNYWTPVLGPPWTAPFEFPLFQWVVAGFAASGIPMDFAGRMVAFIFAVVTVWPLRRIARLWILDENLVSALWLLSPVVLYWGTCFLIETTAIFCGAMFLWLTLEKRYVFALLSGLTSAMVKGTSFVTFAIASMSWAALPPLLAGLLWQKWTDLQKPIGTLIGAINSTQPSQRLHNYGNLTDRLLVPHILAVRAEDILGPGALILLLVAVLSGAWRYHYLLRWHWSLILGFVLVPFIFPRLFIVHEYYAIEIAPLAVLIVAAVIKWMVPVLSERAFAAGFIACEMIGFFAYVPRLRAQNPIVAPAQSIEAHTKPPDVLLIYGMQWDPELAYYARRKAVMFPDSLLTCEEIAARSVQYHPTVVIRCPSRCDGRADYERVFESWGVGRPQLDSCVTAYLD